MANPYSYYPEQGMLKPALDIADTATRLYGIREHSRLRENELAQRGRIADEENLVRQEANSINRQNANTHAQKLMLDTPQHKQEFKPTVLLQSQVAAKQMYGEEGVKAFMPLYDGIKEVGMIPKSTYKDVHDAAMSLYPQKREEIMGSLEKQLLSGKLTPEQQKQLGAVYDAVAYDKTGERIIGMGIMKNTADSIRMEQENSKAALMEQKQAGFEMMSKTKEELARIAADARVEAARTAADARVRAAERGAQSRENVADTNAEARKATSGGKGKKSLADALNPGAAAPSGSPADKLKGQAPGVYKVNNQVIQWDGTKVLE